MLAKAEAYAESLGAVKAAPTRDAREPGRKQKLSDEGQLAAAVRLLLRKQQKRVMDYARMLPQATKAAQATKAVDIPDTLLEDEEARMQIYRIMLRVMRAGVELYAANAGVDLDYTLVHATAARAAQRLALNLIKEINSTTKDTIRQAIADYVTTPGMTLGDVSERLATSFDAARADRIAVTEVTRAYAEANQTAADEMKRQLPDVKVVKIWYTNRDDIVCDLCGPLNGVEVESDQSFPYGDGEIANPPAHPNCLPADRLVLPIGRIAATSERQFDGYVVIVDTAGHKNLACTPNHPVLTPRGWVPARLLNIGDYVISGRPGHLPFASHADDQDMPASIHDVAESFRRYRQMFTAPVPVSAEDFHGDGEGSDVAIVNSDCLLRRDRQAAVLQQSNEFDFAGGLVQGKTLNSQSMFQFGGFGAGRSAHRIMSGADLSGALAYSHARPLDALRVGLRADRDSVLSEKPADCGAVDAPSLRYGVLGLSVGVCLDQVVGVRNVQFSGHVFNLQTESGIYIADGIITHNCRCWTDVRTRING